MRQKMPLRHSMNRHTWYEVTLLFAKPSSPSSRDPQRRNVTGPSGNKNAILKTCVTCGLALGTVLLAQMIAAYRFVSSDLVQREAQSETNRKIVAVEQMARVLGTQDTGQLSEIVNETMRESPTQIAWVRILQLDGTPIAMVGVPAEKLYSRLRMQRAIESREILSKIVKTPTGQVFVTARPFHPDLGAFGGAATARASGRFHDPSLWRLRCTWTPWPRRSARSESVFSRVAWQRSPS